MKQKTLKNYIYDGLGFPIELKTANLVLIDGEWCPKVDVRRVADSVIQQLPYQKEIFTGNQIKFIRTYFAMSLREFAKKVVKESHTAVSNWESQGDDATHMDTNIEMMLRLYIYDQTVVKTKEQQRAFYGLYKVLRDTDFRSHERTPVMMKVV